MVEVHGDASSGTRGSRQSQPYIGPDTAVQLTAFEQANARGAARGTLKKFVPGPMAAVVTGVLAENLIRAG